ncbi:MAG: hypothetical protein JSV09_14245 [Thermoplasmata archaeon]|nr:MAG: hypothetical protein JSV09_14245 [Thermoplasmata archaeon]
MQVNMDDVVHITETGLTIRGSRRCAAIPKPTVDKIRLGNGDIIRWILFKDRSMVITEVKR